VRRSQAGIPPEEPGDRQQMKAIITRHRTGLPDLRVTVEDLIAEGEKVAIRWKMQATHEHAFRGIAPGGKPVTVTGTTVLRIVDGKIVERWVNWDSLALRQPSETVQIGAV